MSASLSTSASLRASLRLGVGARRRCSSLRRRAVAGLDALSARARSTCRTSSRRPRPAHWLGADALGPRRRSREILAGARVSLLVGVIAVGIGLVFGVALGLVAASARRRGSRTRS